jgi:DNA helicase II / ATP-dependent DNA helicase PcrA
LYAKHLGLQPTFTVLDRSDAADVMDVVRHELGFSQKDKRFPARTPVSRFTRTASTRACRSNNARGAVPLGREWEPELTRIYREYVLRKQKNNVLDYDDLLLYWHVMMQNPALAQNLAKNFDHVLVDEYQDTSTLQGEIVLALKPDGAGVTVVGDDAQAIYSFRAAAVDNILGFADRFKPKADIVVLAQNYRSTQPILDCANTLMAEGARQHRKTLIGNRPSSQKPLYVSLDDTQAQAEYITRKILITRESGGSLKRHAILFRNSHHSDLLELELTRKNIPYVKYGGLKFLEAGHVKDLLSILRWADNPRNSVAGFRVLKLIPGIGPAHAKTALDMFEAKGYSVTRLREFEVPQLVKMDWKRFCEFFEKLADPQTPWAGQVGLVKEWYKPQLERLYDSGWTRVGDLDQLEQLSVQHPTRERFLSELTLDPPSVSSDQSGRASKDEEYVILSTIHSAKGQEWDFVYVLNVGDGIFPSEFSNGKPELVEEERRLLYVAMTRARNELHLCVPLRYAVTQQPKDGDAHIYGAKSRFMTDKVVACFEKAAYSSLRGAETLRAAEDAPVDTARVDVVGQLKDMW